MRTDKSAQIAAAADTKIINAGVNRHSHSGGAHSSCAQKLCLAYNVEGGNKNAPDCAEQHQQIMIDAYGVEQQQNNCNAKYGDAEEVIAAFIIPLEKAALPKSPAAPKITKVMVIQASSIRAICFR